MDWMWPDQSAQAAQVDGCADFAKAFRGVILPGSRNDANSLIPDVRPDRRVQRVAATTPADEVAIRADHAVNREAAHDGVRRHGGRFDPSACAHGPASDLIPTRTSSSPRRNDEL